MPKLVSTFAAATTFCAAVHAPPTAASDLSDLDIIKKAVSTGLLDRATAALWVKDPKLRRQIPVRGRTEISKDRLAGSRTVQTKQVTRYFENWLGNRILSNTLTKRWCYDGVKVCGDISSSVSRWKAGWALTWTWHRVDPDDKQDYYYTYQDRANGGHKTRRVAVWHAFGTPDAACVQLHIWSHYDGTSTPTGSSSNC
ncbi:hypothetical protein AB0I81_17435 [Nonomuraea sp. NPDC050404]|uniref:hypothetical protein n=1 Tax=Nonomuraea sp. NPDC050404 TaxID=3155783 RepID=UPI0033FB708D